MRLRTVATAVAALLALTALAGCRTNIGTAATVNGTRITESQVNRFLNPAGPDAAEVAAAKSSNRSVSPRSQVLQILLQQQVFEAVLRHFNITPSENQLAGYHDQAASLLLQTALTGDKLDQAIRTGLPRSGISADLTPTYLRTQELEFAIIKAKSLTQLPELIALVKQAGVHVTVSPRYGTWDPMVLGLDNKASVPSYLTVQPTGG